MKSPPEKPARSSRRKSTAERQNEAISASQAKPLPKDRDWDYDDHAPGSPLQKDPGLVACHVMLKAVLAECEDADFITWQQVCVILHVVPREWQTYALEIAWREIMGERRGVDPRVYGSDKRWEVHLEGHRLKSNYVAELTIGKSILVVTNDPAEIEPTFQRAADVTLRLDVPTPRTVAAIIGALTRRPMVYDVPERLCARLTPDLLRLSFRRGQHPEDLLDRLLKVADIPEEIGATGALGRSRRGRREAARSHGAGPRARSGRSSRLGPHSRI